MTTVAAISAIAAPVTLVAATLGDTISPFAGEPLAHRAADQLIRTQDASPAVRFADGAADVGVTLSADVVRGEAAAIQGLAAPAIEAVVAPAPTTTAPAPTTTAPPPPAPAPAPAAAPSGAYADPSDPATWDRLAKCESGGNWSINTGNGYYGGLQFSASTWRSVGGTGLPHEHSRETQIEMGQRLQASAGWGQWPHCTRKLGYR